MGLSQRNGHRNVTLILFEKNFKSQKINMVYFELGRTPLYINRYIRMICYWLKLLETDNCFLKNLYVWLSQSVVNTKLFLSEFKQRVIDNYIAEGLSFF